MATTIVGLFDSFTQAQHAVDELVKAGFDRQSISVVANESARGRSDAGTTGGVTDGSGAAKGAATGAVAGTAVGAGAALLAILAGVAIPGIGAVLAAGPIVALLTGAGIGAGVGAAAGGLIGALTGSGVPEDEARVYAEGVKRGGTLVSLTTEDARAEAAASVLESAGAVDVDERATQYGIALAASRGTAGTTGTAGTAGATGAGASSLTGQRSSGAMAGRDAGDEFRAEVVEEQIAIGKRQVEGGRVRVRTYVTEKPVEKDITLHEEHVHVERRAVDRPAEQGDLVSTGEEEIVVTERREEPVVQKRARVVEEIVVSKEQQDRTETIHDTVRRKDVRVEQEPPTGMPGRDSDDQRRGL